MLSVGKHFAIAAILAMFFGFVRWPQPATGLWAITIKNRAYCFGYDYWAFSWGAVFAAFAAVYYWFPVVFSRSLSERMTQLHFWLSAAAALGFLLLVPTLQALTAPRAGAVSGTTVAVRSEPAMMATLVIGLISSLLFLVAPGIFVATLCWDAIRKTGATSR